MPYSDIYLKLFYSIFELENNTRSRFPHSCSICAVVRCSYPGTFVFVAIFVHIMSNIRERIKRHLELSGRLDTAAKEVFDENKDITVIAQYHGLDLRILNRKVQILKMKVEHFELKCKLEPAVNAILYNRVPVSDAAKTYDVPVWILDVELKKFKKSESGTYIYDGLTIDDGVFTFNDEFLLLKQLHYWERNSVCFCQFCALEHLLSLAYQLAKKNNIPYPSEWNRNEKADEIWLFEFEMRFSIEIAEFEFDDLCEENKPPSALQPLWSFDQQGIVEQSLCAHLEGGFGPSQFSNVPIMCNINRDGIKDHLRISYELHITANELLRDADESGFHKKITSVSKQKGLPSSKLRSKVTILQRKQAYYNLKSSIENILNVVFNEGISKTRATKIYKNKITSTILGPEYDKRAKLGSSYQYEELVKPRGVFTYLEEASLLNDLNVWINSTQDRCHCQVCSLVYIMESAYKLLANREKKDYTSDWNKLIQVDLEWIYEYEMRHYDEISNLEGPNSCLLESQASVTQLLTSFDKQQISKPMSTSRGQLQEDIEISKPSTSRGHLQENIEIPKTSTSRGHLQGDIEQEQDPNVHIRESIKKHIQLSDTLSKAADEILYEKKDIIDIALSYELDLWILERKVKISKRTNNYLAILCKAIYKYVLLSNNRLCEIEDECVKEYNMESEFQYHVIAECRRFFSIPKYEYNKITISYKIFTSSEEEKILEQLYQWKGANAQCHCIICAMEHLLNLAYQFAKERNIQHPPEWDVYEKVDEIWLLEFQMRNSEEICKFDPVSSCTKEPPASTSARLPSSSLDQQEISELSTLYAHQPKHSKPLQNSNIHIMPDIRGRIRRHLEISDQLDKAAKQVLEENKDIGSVARNHKLDLWILNQKVQILKLRKEQFDISSRFQSAVNSVRFNIISVSDAAERYNVHEDFIKMNLSELEDSENIMYVQLRFKEDLYEKFKISMEFLLLKRLRCLSKDLLLPRKCCCRTCALEYLPSLAYQFALENDIKTPFPWDTNEKADEIWMYKFQMRHSIEIAKHFSHKCKAEEELASASASLYST